MIFNDRTSLKPFWIMSQVCSLNLTLTRAKDQCGSIYLQRYVLYDVFVAEKESFRILDDGMQRRMVIELISESRKLVIAILGR